MAQLAFLGTHRVLIDLPSADPDDLVAAGEVLLQEGSGLWTLSIDRVADLAALQAVFGHRAIIGVHDARGPADLERLGDTTPAFVMSPFADPQLVRAAGEIPVILGGLTPSEIAAALRAGAAGVQVIPSDALGSLYSRTLPALFPGEPLLATGRMERFQCEMWLDAGARAVCPLGTITADDVEDPDLGALRRRVQGLDFRT